MLGASGIHDRSEAGDIDIQPFVEGRVRPRGYDIAASGDVYRLQALDRPVNPLHHGSVTAAIEPDPAIVGEIVVKPDEAVTILSRERVALDPSLAAVPSTHPTLTRLGLDVTCDPDGIPAPDNDEGATRIACVVRSASPTPVVLHPDQPILRLRFAPVDGPDTAATTGTLAGEPRPDFAGLTDELVSEDLCVGITGLAASGKSVSAERLADLLDAETYSMGQIIRDAADRRGLERTGEHLNQVSQELREEHGDDVVAERLVERLSTDDSSGVRIIEGIRGPGEVAVFRRELTDAFFLLGVHASRPTRVARLRERGRSDDAGGAEALETRDEKESGFGVREAIGMCDHIITNEGSIAELERDVERVAARICYQYG